MTEMKKMKEKVGDDVGDTRFIRGQRKLGTESMEIWNSYLDSHFPVPIHNIFLSNLNIDCRHADSNCSLKSVFELISIR